jgi:hypothetical protein
MFEEELTNLTQIINKLISKRKEGLRPYYEFIKKQEEFDITYNSFLECFREGYLISKNDVIAKGTNQIVIPVSESMVAKTRYKLEHLNNFIVDSKAYDFRYKDHYQILKNFGIPVQENYIIHCNNGKEKIEVSLNEFNTDSMSSEDISRIGLGFLLTKDLRESGKFKIYECEEDFFKLANNSNELKSQYEGYCNFLMNIHKKSKAHKFLLNDHLDKNIRNNPLPAIKRSFLLKIDNKGNGYLEFGDLINFNIIYKETNSEYYD